PPNDCQGLIEQRERGPRLTLHNMISFLPEICCDPSSDVKGASVFQAGCLPRACRKVICSTSAPCPSTRPSRFNRSRRKTIWVGKLVLPGWRHGGAWPQAQWSPYLGRRRQGRQKERRG